MTTTEQEIDDEEASQALTVDSDAAVAAPKQQHSSRKKRISRKFSFGAPSTAALAALASDDGNDSEKDIEALLPVPKPTSKKKHGLQQIRRSRTLDSTKTPMDVASLKKKILKRKESKDSSKKPSSTQRHSLSSPAIANLDNKNDSSSDDGEDDMDDNASDCAVAKPKQRGSFGAAAKAVLGSFEETEIVPVEPEAIEALLPEDGGKEKKKKKVKVRKADSPKAPPGTGKDQEQRSSNSPKQQTDRTKSQRQQKALRGKNPSFDRISAHTGTSRTGSIPYSEYQSSMRDDSDHRSTTSRYTSKTHRTLKEIRAEKNPALAEEAKKKKNVWCCGLSKCTWAVIIFTGFCGFAVGFIVPLLQMLKQQPDLSVTPPAGTLPPSDPSEVTLAGTKPDSDEATVPQVATTTAAPVIPFDEPVETQEEEKEEAVPAIDVWTLFGTDHEDLPTASAYHLASSSTFSEDHLQQAALLFVQGTIQQNVQNPKVALERKYQVEGEYVVPFVDTPLAAFDGEMPYPTARTPADKYPQGDVTRWEQLLAELGVQEADTLQWDKANDVLYVAHGKHIDVIDTKAGSIRATIQLPRAEEHLAKDSWLMPAESDVWQPAPPEPFIEQLLLTATKDHLVVVVSDYSYIHQAKIKPLLKDSLVTQLFTYQLSHRDDITEYKLIDEPLSLHGRVLYAAQATSNQHIHVVTSSSIDTTRLLQDPLERLYYPNRHDTVYVDEVTEAAQDKYVPLYVKRLMNEIDALGEDLTLLPFTKWVTGEEASGEEERQLEHVVAAQEHLQELVVVTSFSIVQTNSASATASLRQASTTTMTSSSTAAISTAFLGPSSTQVIGSTDTHLTLSVAGHRWSSTDEGGRVLQEATHVLQWELGTLTLPGASHRAATRFKAMGTVPGRLVQAPRHSTHRHGNELRLATVMTSQWKVSDPMMIEVDKTQVRVEESFVHKSFLNVLDQRTLQPRGGSPLQLFTRKAALLSSVTFLDDVAYAFPLEPASASAANETAVQVIALDSSSEEDSEVPVLQVSGSISPVPQGFSRYLHELHSNGKGERLLMSIGHNTSDDGLMNGWLLTVWNASDAIEGALELLVRHSLEVPGTITTWKPQTFRVTPHGQVILPMTVEHIGRAGSEEDMKGFIVLNVSPIAITEFIGLEITELRRVPHSTVVMSAGECIPGDVGCGLEGQSFWRDSDDGLSSLLTVEGAVVKRTRLSSEGSLNDPEEWSLALP